MRYRNLTITITLTCLSIIAIAGLLLLPMRGDCIVIKHGWTGYNNNTAANIIVTETTDGASWQIIGDVDAKAVNATVYTTPHNLPLFTDDAMFKGHGWVVANRQNYTKYHTSTDWAFCWSMIDAALCPGHFKAGDIDTNKLDSPYYNGGDTALVLDIEANAKVEKHTGHGYKKEDSKKESFR